MAFWTFAGRPAVATEPVAMLDPATLKDELRHAYDRGRLDERSRRRGSGLLGLVLVVAAIIGVFLIILAYHDGSFSAGGAAVDGAIAQMRGQVTAAAPTLSPGAGNAGAPSNAAH
jgi:hypothetical protein